MSCAEHRKIKCISKTDKEIVFKINIFLTLFVKYCHNIGIYMKIMVTENKNGTCKYSETGLKITLHSVSEMRTIWLKSKETFTYKICNVFKRSCPHLLKQKHISKHQKSSCCHLVKCKAASPIPRLWQLFFALRGAGRQQFEQLQLTNRQQHWAQLQ